MAEAFRNHHILIRESQELRERIDRLHHPGQELDQAIKSR
jgi:hypothetical protein